ncbi:MAG TPA: lysophospholipid acyltransferase family protein [Gemmatimonadaceae bacterium]|nr:lysophospholipid acyltransferase family protein [Gemmatimonadaceae bacterium]
MLYAVLRQMARLALRWYYSEIDIVGVERVPLDVPLLVVANHPNAVVDPMLVASTLPRRLTFTGKATLFENPLLRVFLRAVGMVPLRRASDERARRGAGGAPDPRRNADAFRAVIEALAARRAVLVFPEGKSHDDPTIAPLKTGTARMALQAREAGVRDIAILPIGFVFEDKARPRTRILVEVGEPLRVDEWAGDRANLVDALTAEIDRRLRALTMNYDTMAEAAEVSRFATALAAEGPGPLGSGTTYAETVAVARRVAAGRRLLATTGETAPGLAMRAAALRTELHALEETAGRHGLDLRDATIDTSLGSGALFALREGAIALAGVPLALIGRVLHWPAITVAGAVARTRSRSGSDPAMQTIVTGAPLVLLTWLAIAALAWRVGGALASIATLALLPALALCDVALRDRAHRAAARARAWLTFRGDPGFQRRLVAGLSSARNEAVQLEEELSAGRELPSAPRSRTSA